MMTSLTTRAFRKNANPQHYNMRHKPSQGKDGVYFHSWAHIHGPNDEAKQSNRDPTAFKYSNNLFRNDYMEWRMRGADYIYQIGSRLHRSNDAWTKCLLAWTGFSFMMFSQALIWKIHFAFFGLATAARIRDKGNEPSMDEVWVLDTVFANEKLKQLFTPTTYHIIDFDQEWEAGLENPYFPEYRTSTSKFFNVDMNTTTGRYKFGDVESGAMMTLHFKTMPFSNNKYHFTEPFMVYDMYAEVVHNGEVFTETIVKAEEHLKSKRIYTVWH